MPLSWGTKCGGRRRPFLDSLSSHLEIISPSLSAACHSYTSLVLVIRMITRVQH